MRQNTYRSAPESHLGQSHGRLVERTARGPATCHIPDDVRDPTVVLCGTSTPLISIPELLPLRFTCYHKVSITVERQKEKNNAYPGMESQTPGELKNCREKSF